MTFKEKKNIEFCIVFFVFFLILFSVFYFFYNSFSYKLMFISLIFLGMSVFKKSSFITILRQSWLGIGAKISIFVSPIAIYFSYYTCLLSVSFISKLFNKNFLNIKYDEQSLSYWENYDKSNKNFDNQF